MNVRLRNSASQGAAAMFAVAAVSLMSAHVGTFVPMTQHATSGTVPVAGTVSANGTVQSGQSAQIINVKFNRPAVMHEYP